MNREEKRAIFVDRMKSKRRDAKKMLIKYIKAKRIGIYGEPVDFCIRLANERIDSYSRVLKNISR